MAPEPWIAAGFFVTKAVARDAGRSPELLPPRLVSLSDCVAPSYQVYWGWDVEKHRAASVAFGIAEQRLRDLYPWEKTHGISHPDVLHSLDDAHDFVREFLSDVGEVTILGAALPAALVDEFLVDNPQRCYDAPNDTWTDVCEGVNLVLTARRPLPEGGERLGHEMVQYADGQLCCSWLCTGTERDVHAELGIRPNAHGLIESAEDALRVDAWIQEHPDRVEPDGAFYPWLLVRYPARRGSRLSSRPAASEPAGSGR